MSFVTGNKIRISLFGQSHSEAMGAVIDGLPSGFKIDEEKLSQFMARRAPGNDEFSTTRKEGDKVKFVSGITDGVTNGAPLCGIIENTNTRSKDYENLKDVPRPGHADFAAWSKFGDSRDVSGGGQFSGRLTATMCIAGGICKQLLEEKGIYIGAHIASIGNKEDDLFDAVRVNKDDFVGEKPFPVINDIKGEAMKEEIRRAKSDADSIGGSIECAITGIPSSSRNCLLMPPIRVELPAETITAETTIFSFSVIFSIITPLYINASTAASFAQRQKTSIAFSRLSTDGKVGAILIFLSSGSTP